MKRGLFLFVLVLVFIIPLASALNLYSCGVLDQPDTEYILQNDVSSSGTCFEIAADDIVLDLNGYTATFGTDDGDQSCGVFIHPSYSSSACRNTQGGPFTGADNITIKNGFIIHGATKNTPNDAETCDDCNVIYSRESTDGLYVMNIHGYVAGIDPQGIVAIYDRNVVVENCTMQMNATFYENRHHYKAAIYIGDLKGGKLIIRNNAAFGVGHFGIIAISRKSYPVTEAEISGNTMRINGITTNPYQLVVTGFSQRDQGITLRIFGNRIEAPEGVSNRGIIFEGIESMFEGVDGAKVYNNYFDCKSRGYPEEGVDKGFTHTFRMRDSGSEPKHFNNEFYNNTFKTTAFYNSEADQGNAYGVRISLAASIPVGQENIFHDNVITATTLNSGKYASAIDFEGHNANAGTIFYNNTITSNSRMFSWYHQGGDNITFRSNTLTLGADPIDFKTFYFYNFIEGEETGQTARDNIFLDNTLGDGVSYKNMYLHSYNPTFRSFWVKWYLDVVVKDSNGNLIPNAQVSIKDKNDDQVFSGTTNAEGKIQTDLTEYYYDASNLIQTDYTPHNITATYSGVSDSSLVTIDSSKAITLTLTLIPCTDGQTRDCGTDVGLCEFGNQTCIGGEWGACIGGVGPQNETCSNGLDEDCNGADLTCLTCSEGQIITRCLCGGSPYELGYCCSGSYQNTSCTTPPANCTINSLSWSDPKYVDEGDNTIQLIVQGTDCDGQNVDFEVWEYDGFLSELLGFPDDPVANTPVSVSFTGGVGGEIATTNWTAEWQDDGLFGLGGNPEYYFIATINGTDYESEKGDSLLSVNLTSRKWETKNVSLNAGKNSFSLPLILEDMSVTGVFQDINDSIEKIYTYDNGFKVHYFDGKPSNLDYLEVGKGYVLFMAQDGNLTINGTKRQADLNRPTITLTPGWNLIGTFSNIYKASDILNDVNYDYNRLYNYDSGTGTFVQISNTTLLEGEKGYWIYVNEESSFVPITGYVAEKELDIFSIIGRIIGSG